MAIIGQIFGVVPYKGELHSTYKLEDLFKFENKQINFDIYDVDLWKKFLIKYRKEIMKKANVTDIRVMQRYYRIMIRKVGGNPPQEILYPEPDKQGKGKVINGIIP